MCRSPSGEEQVTLRQVKRRPGLSPLLGIATRYSVQTPSALVVITCEGVSCDAHWGHSSGLGREGEWAIGAAELLAFASCCDKEIYFLVELPLFVSTFLSVSADPLAQ
ncbi:hypothetical protein TYRP_011754, partial [Tyrophagus putrescentiae]